MDWTPTYVHEMSDELTDGPQPEVLPGRWARVVGADAGGVEVYKELAASYWYCVYAWWRPLLKVHTEIEVLVPIETPVKNAKWRSAVVVFGDPRNLDVFLEPHREGETWKDFEFPERAALVEQGKDAGETKK